MSPFPMLLHARTGKGKNQRERTVLMGAPSERGVPMVTRPAINCTKCGSPSAMGYRLHDDSFVCVSCS